MSHAIAKLVKPSAVAVLQQLPNIVFRMIGRHWHITSENPNRAVDVSRHLGEAPPHISDHSFGCPSPNRLYVSITQDWFKGWRINSTGEWPDFECSYLRKHPL